MGDLNSVRWSNEKIGGARPNLTSMNELNDCIDSCGLEDIKLKGQLYYWSNSSTGPPRIAYELDKALINSKCMNFGLQLEGTLVPPCLFDYSPVLISTAITRSIKVPFQYFNFWAKEKGFFKIVNDTWDINIFCTPMHCVVKKLANVKKALRQWRMSKPTIPAQIQSAK